MPTSRVRTHRSVTLPALALSLVCGALTACSSSGDISLDRSGSTTTAASGGGSAGTDGPGSLGWGTCRDVRIAATDDALTQARRDGMECATLDVPIDHADPDGPTTRVAVGRYPATGKDRIGSLVVNPGGPGGSGLEFLVSSAIALPQELRKRFDIVSFDPRGIAASSPLDCLTQTQRAEMVDTEDPDDPAAAAAKSVADEQAIAEGCAKDDDDLFRHMGTDQVAGDLDDLRAALGDEQLTFLGLSYGTRIAAAYATQFPDHVRALVLDGSVTPSRDLAEMQGGQIKGIVRALGAFVDQCNADSTCAIAPDALGRLTAVGEQLDATPLTISTDHGDEVLDRDKYVTGVVTALYDPSVSMALGDAVAAIAGDDADRAQEGGRFLVDLAGQQSSKEPDGTYGNGFETQGVVNCLDADRPLEADRVPQVRAIAGTIPPVLDTDPASDAPSCISLPTGDGLRIEPTSATDRLLVVGTTGDPATPIEWTGAMAEALGGPKVITYGGGGHTASLTRACITDQVTEFLVTGKVPADAHDCARDPEESDIYAQIANQFETMGLGAEVGECVAAAIRDEVDPLGVISLNREDADPAVVKKLQQAALSCR